MQWTDVSAALANSQSDKQGTEHHSHRYGFYYDAIFNSQYAKKGSPLRILEIGVSLLEDGSLSVFSQLDIVELAVGVDVNDYKGEFNENLSFVKLPAYSTDTIDHILEHYGNTFDIIIDDASHESYDQLWFADNYEVLLAENGIMVVEDIPQKEAVEGLAERGYKISDGWANRLDNTAAMPWEKIAFKPKTEVTQPVGVVEQPEPQPLSFPAKLTLHVLALPFGTIDDQCFGCAFTQKARDWSEMMASLGCEVIVYAPEGSKVEGCEVVEVVSQKRIQESYPGWEGLGVELAPYEINDAVFAEFNDNTEIQLRSRLKRHDFIYPVFGYGHKEICDRIYNHKQHVGAHVVEAGIGYPTCFQSEARIYESGYKQAFDRGRRATNDPSYAWEFMNDTSYDHNSSVIGNYFNPEHFICDKPREKHDLQPYALFVGRIIDSKGIYEAIEATKQAGINLYIAGHDAPQITRILPEHCRYLGPIGPEKRAYYMTHADVTITWSWYGEPFCGVHVQSLLCRTPVITSNCGVFHETVRNGVNGYRAQWPADIVTALRNIGNIDPEDCYKSALPFTTDALAIKFYYNLQGFLRLLNNIPTTEWADDPLFQSLDWSHDIYDADVIIREKQRIRDMINNEIHA